MFVCQGSPPSICEALPCRFTAEESDTTLVQNSFMSIPAVSHNGASAVRRAWLIRDLKRRGRSAALPPYGCRVASVRSRALRFCLSAFGVLWVCRLSCRARAFGSSRRGEVHHGTL